MCSSWHGVLPAPVPGNAFALLPWCFVTAPAPRNPAGQVWKAGQGWLGRWRLSGCQSGCAGLISTAGQGAALATSRPLSPGRSVKNIPFIALVAFKDNSKGCSV